MLNAAEVVTRPPDRITHDAELRALLAKVAQHDRAAFRCLYHALRPALARHLHRQLPNADLVEELLNDVMYVVWQNAGNFRGDAQVTTWVLGIATMKSHRARQRWRREQAFIDHPEKFPAARHIRKLPAPKRGYVHTINAAMIARGVHLLGAGKETEHDKIDHSVGVSEIKKVGTQVKQGEPLMMIHYNDEAKLEQALEYFKNAYRLAPKRPTPPPLVVERVA